MEDPERVLGWWQRCRRLGSRAAVEPELWSRTGSEKDEGKNQKSVVRGKAKFNTSEKSQKVALAILP